MTIELAQIINPTDIDVMRKTKEIFDIKIKELRQNPENKEKYLIFHDIKPWNKMRFIIGTKKDYENAKINKDYEILMGDEI